MLPHWNNHSFFITKDNKVYSTPNNMLKKALQPFCSAKDFLPKSKMFCSNNLRFSVNGVIIYIYYYYVIIVLHLNSVGETSFGETNPAFAVISELTFSLRCIPWPHHKGLHLCVCGQTFNRDETFRSEVRVTMLFCHMRWKALSHLKSYHVWGACVALHLTIREA